MAMYLKEISAIEEKVDLQYFRYENWKEHLSAKEGAWDKESITENLKEVFEDIDRESWIEPNLALKDPRILVEARLKWWYDCSSENKACEDNEGDSCSECPHHIVHDSCFIYGDTKSPDSDNPAVIPVEVMRALVKCMREGFSIPIFTELVLINLETGNLIIQCEEINICKVLVVEIDTTELRAVKKLLGQLGLFPPA